MGIRFGSGGILDFFGGETWAVVVEVTTEGSKEEGTTTAVEVGWPVSTKKHKYVIPYSAHC